MPLHYAPSGRADRVVARCTGILDPDETLARIDAAYASGIVRPGTDRVVLVERGCSLNRMTLQALVRVRDRVLEHETRDGRPPAFQVAVFDPEPLHRGLVQLYKAVWDQIALPLVGVTVADSFTAAWLALDRVAASRRQVVNG